ncbi:hypothetical protein MAH3_01660 [Sessilibacter sp. MAH3]
MYEIRTKIWGRALTNPGFNQSTKIDNAISNFGQIQLFTVFEIGDTFFCVAGYFGLTTVSFG